MDVRGFTLIELMIVVAIIAIIAAIAIPNMLIARRSANETSAVASMRTLSTAQSTYQSGAVRTDATSGMAQYGSLTQLSAAGVVDASLGSAAKSGYDFTVTAVDNVAAPTYQAEATPANYPSSGIKTLFVDQSGVIRFRVDGTSAGSADAPII